jgi:hypothetical protein
MQSRKYFTFGMNFNILTTPLFNVQFTGGQPAPVSNYLITEDSNYLITEDGNNLITES